LKNSTSLCSIQTEFKNISEKAIKIVLQFSTLYLCEHGFSTLTNIKTKNRERLTNIEKEMRVVPFTYKTKYWKCMQQSSGPNITLNNLKNVFILYHLSILLYYYID